MNQKLLNIFFLFFLFCCFGQQNQEFKEVKNYYDYQRFMLNSEFKKRFDQENNLSNKISIEGTFQQFMVKLDSIQNYALVNALVKVKIREDLDRLKVPTKLNTELENPTKNNLSKDAKYPGGFNLMRQQLVDLFYTNAVLADHKILKTDLLFVVEKDGSISSVKAKGDNFTFNRQAEIALYSLPDKFSPALVNGTAIRYRFRLPLAMDFE